MDYHQLICDIDIPVIILDVDQGHFVDCNDKALRFFKLRKEDFLTKDPFDVSPKHIYGRKSKEYSEQVIQQALAGENPVFDWIHLDSEGAEIPCEIRLIRFPPYDKNLVRGTIIEKHQQEDQDLILRESEERLRLTLQSVKIGTFDWYPKTDKVIWDEGLYKIFELNSNEDSDLNARFFSVIHDEDKERVEKEFAHSLKPNGPNTYQIEYRISVNGTVKHLLANSKMVRDDTGEVIRMLGTTQDITKLRESEEKLRQSEKLFRSMVQDQGEMIVRWKKGGIRTFANRAYLDKFGLSEEEVVGSTFFDLIDAKDQEAVIAKLETLTPENPTATKTHRVYLPDGSTGWQEWTDRAIFNDDGIIQEFQSTGRDITEIVKARKAIEESEVRYRRIFNQQFQFTALLDLEGRVVDINELPLKMQSLPKEAFIGDFFWNSPGWKGNKALQQKVKDQLARLKSSKEPFIVEDAYDDPEGKTRYAISHYSLIRDSEGRDVQILVQATDITNEKMATQEIEERERQLSLIYNSSNDFMLLMRVEKSGYFIESVNEATIKGLESAGIRTEKSKLEGLNMLDYFKDVLHYTQEQINVHFEVYQKVKRGREIGRYTTESYYNEQLFAIDTTAIPIIESDAVNYILTVSRDISGLLNSKVELQKAYEEVEALKKQLEQENIYLKEEIRQANDFENMVFKSAAFRKVLNKVEQVAKTDATVLITGETGTGKELIARAIHNTSKRSAKPMIKVNTAAIPRDLIESELFGYEKGAFTGAGAEKPGKFELADGGTIFLDEIGDMPLDLQVKILRVLQEGEVERLGSIQSRKIDVRIISATNKNLEAAVKEAKFREDLYFRLNVFPVEIPPLRSRPDDVPILVEHFVSKFSVKHSKRISAIPKPVMDYLRNYSWPGNVRELENTIERAIILTYGETLELPEVVDSDSIQEQWEHDNSLDVIQENHIRKVLAECKWKVEGKGGAATQLKIKPSTLRDKMKKFDIKRP